MRRKFVDIVKISKKPTIALTIIEQIKALYAIEKQAKELLNVNIDCRLATIKIAGFF